MPKPAFNPNQPFEAVGEKAAKPAFDPNQPFDAVNAPEKMPELESALSGFSEGATYGFMDEFGGHLEALGSKVGLRGLGSPHLKDIRLETQAEDALPYDAVYEQGRDLRREHQGAAAEANPKAHFMGQFGGTLVSPVTKVTTPIKGASLAANMGRAALGGGIVGAGASENNPFTSPEEARSFVRDVGTNAAGGVFFDRLLAGGGKVAGKLLPERLKQFARERAVKAATGQNKKMIKQASKLGQINDVGDALLEGAEDLGISAPNKFASSVEDIRDNAAKGADKAWQAVEEVFGSIDNQTSGASIDGRAIARRLLDKASKITAIPENETMIQSLLNKAAWLEKQGAMSLKKAQELKNNYIFKMADTKTHALGLDGNNQVRAAYTEAMEDAIEAAGGPQALAKFLRAKKVYGSLATAAGAADDRALANISNRFFSPTDYGVGLATGVASAAKNAAQTEKPAEVVLSGLTGLAATMGHKFLRERGSSMAASAALGASKLTGSQGARTIIGAAQGLQYTPATNIIMQRLNSGGGTEE